MKLVACWAFFLIPGFLVPYRAMLDDPAAPMSIAILTGCIGVGLMFCLAKTITHLNNYMESIR